MAYLELRDVYFEYPSGHVAVEGVSISADLGEKIAIIGENGAGKTTTAKLMNGLLKPTKGEVLINGVSTKGKTTATIARKVAYVFKTPTTKFLIRRYWPKFHTRRDTLRWMKKR